ncbi:hypothetical protein MAP00_002050 [Monascus purpureus]|nr:hypothetical protein MAP00_002050 [Monascus purpureus]
MKYASYRTQRNPEKRKVLEYDILILMFSEDVRYCWQLSLSGGGLLHVRFLLSEGEDLGIRSFAVSLFLVRDLFESIELLSVELVKLRIDVFKMLVGIYETPISGWGSEPTFDGILRPRNDNMFTVSNQSS